LALKVGSTTQKIQNWYKIKRRRFNDIRKKHFDKTVTNALLKEYEKNKYPDQQTKVKLALQVGLTLQQVSRWYKSKRRRFNDAKKKNFDETVKNALLKEYEKNKYPDQQTKVKLALQVGLTLQQVSIWFKNARKKLNKSKKIK